MLGGALFGLGGYLSLAGGTLLGRLILPDAPAPPLVFGAADGSHPGLKRNGAGLVVRLGDDSANAALTADKITLSLAGTGAVALDSAGQVTWNGDSGLGRGSGAATVKVTDASTGYGSLEPKAVNFPAGLGGITHILGPSDQDLTIASVSGKHISITPGGNGNRVYVGSNATNDVRLGVTSHLSWSGSGGAGNTQDLGITRSAAAVLKVTDATTGLGSVLAQWPRRSFAVYKTPGTGTTLSADSGAPTHTVSGTAANQSDSTGHYLQCTASGAVTAGVDIAATECVKTEIGPIVTFVIKTGANLPVATERIWVGFSSASLATADSPTGAHVMGFRYAPTVDGTAFWRFVTNDGGADAGTETTTTAAIAVSTRYILTIDARNSGQIKGYVNGVEVAAHTTNLPTVTQALGTQCLVRDTAGGADKILSISNINFETN